MAAFAAVNDHVCRTGAWQNLHEIPPTVWAFNPLLICSNYTTHGLNFQHLSAAPFMLFKLLYIAPSLCFPYPVSKLQLYTETGQRYYFYFYGPFRYIRVVQEDPRLAAHLPL